MLEYIFRPDKKISSVLVYIIIMLIGIIMMLSSCEKSSYYPLINDLSNKPEVLNGKWIDNKYPQNKITITDSTISQVGFPLVAGDDIKRKGFKCTYRGPIYNQPRDSFRLRIIELKGSYLNLEIDNYYGTRDKIFIKE